MVDGAKYVFLVSVAASNCAYPTVRTDNIDSDSQSFKTSAIPAGLYAICAGCNTAGNTEAYRVKGNTACWAGCNRPASFQSLLTSYLGELRGVM